MATAVTVTFGANTEQFQAELAKMQSMAASAGRRMGSSMAGGHMVGQTGIVRETAVIGREIAMGRGMGRILASMTLLTQYINSATKNAKQGTSAAVELAESYERVAIKARMAAVAAFKKAAATGADAEAEGFEIQATVDAVDADEAQAKAANQAAIALEEKAIAATNAAAAEEALAAANATASTSFLKAALPVLGLFALLLVIIAELYVVAKALTEIFGRVSKAQQEAAKYANEHTLAIWEEIEAMEKLKDASEKTAEAIKKMNEAKDRSVELTHNAIEASKAESEARDKLYEAGVKGKLLDIEIAEKKGLITHQQAIQQKTAVESQAVEDKAAAKQAQLDTEAKITADASAKAEKDKADAQAKAQAASDKINKSPEGIKRAEMLAQAEKDLHASKSEAESAAKDLIEFNSGGSNLLYSSSLKSRLEGFGGSKDKAASLKETADAAANAAASAEIRIASLKRFMSPDEKAAAEALSMAGEKSNAANTLKNDAEKAATAAATNAANSPAEVAAEKANLLKAAQLQAMEKGGEKSYSLNSQQRIGAYAATPPVLMQQLNALRAIQANTTPRPGNNTQPPGPKPPQIGDRPAGHGEMINGNNVWVTG